MVSFLMVVFLVLPMDLPRLAREKIIVDEEEDRCVN
jgi:hypothetical protein